MITKEVREVKYFLNSQAFADGLKMSFGIVLPSIISSYFNHFDIGLTISLGALCVCLADAPGPYVHKKNGMLICSFFVFLVALITIYARLNVYTLGLQIALVTFFFSMFTVYGVRAISVGNAAILIMILTMDKPVLVSQAFSVSLLILVGGLFYTGLSLLFYKLRPYRIVQRSLGECIRELATYLSIKADFYTTSTDLNNNYKKLLAQQIIVHEKQDAVRELLFKTTVIVKESTVIGRKLLWTFVESVDLFEEMTASYYNYESLRNHYSSSGVLDKVAFLLKEIANEFDKMGIAIQSNYSYSRNPHLESLLKSLKNEIDIIQIEGLSNLVLKKVFVNIRNLYEHYLDMNKYFEAEDIRGKTLDHTKFISHQSLDPKLIWNNLSFSSSVFKHALRVSIACMVGYLIANLISYGHHSYWIIMTIAFMLKPAFSLTKQRNIQRITGTIIGGAAGLLILVFVHNKNIQLAFLIIFMIGTYSFIRINYLVMVLCTTPYILILFNFLGLGFKEVAEERLLDTAIGCAIAFSASYFLFPHWESAQVKTYMKQMLKANAQYLSLVAELLSGVSVNILKYKIIRKEVYVASANLSSTFQRMLSEPKGKQVNEKKVHQFVVLNTILFSNIAQVAKSLILKEGKLYPYEYFRITKKALSLLNHGLEKLDDATIPVIDISVNHHFTETSGLGEDDLFKDQLNFICKVSTDINRTIDSIVAA
ncbi:MAG: FUSC family membrane protein [Flavisolibacter sp.]